MTQQPLASPPPFADGPVLWEPPPDILDRTTVGRYLRWLASERGMQLTTYDELHAWSIADLDGFWGSVWDFFKVRSGTPRTAALAESRMPGASWFPGTQLNYAEHTLDGDSNEIAVLSRSQTRPPAQLTRGQLRDQVARARAGLSALGVGPGDRVAAYLPNMPETLVAFLATTSLGAVWAACPPEFGARAVIDRFAQIEPKVLLVVGGYGFRDRSIDRRDQVATLRAALPSVTHVVDVPYSGHVVPDALPWPELLAHHEPLSFAPVTFDHPLCILFSSGTTGLPKAIVHSHGGLLVEHFKNMGLSWDLGPGERLLQFTTTAWMMWNVLVSGLLVGASIVMVDGDPTWPELDWQWQLAAETGATTIGASPAWIMACRKAGIPLEGLPLNLRAVVTSGSPLPAEGYRWLYEQLGREVLVVNASGGTDVCTGLVSGSFLQPVYEGEISGPCLGVDVKAYDAHGATVVGAYGEMIVEQPMPSMPVGFWGDPDGARLRAAYFEEFPGVWRQGDLIRFTRRGSCVISGRSDATLNRGGVRLGTGDFYAVVEELDGVSDSLVVHLEAQDGGVGELVLFLAGAPVDDALRRAVTAALRGQLSPRHVPDTIIGVPAIPRTLTGKKLEAPVKRILQGAAPDAVLSPGALLDPTAVEAFVAYAATR